MGAEAEETGMAELLAEVGSETHRFGVQHAHGGDPARLGFEEVYVTGEGLARDDEALEWPEAELYDHQSDPDEWEPLATDPDSAEVRVDLESLLQEWMHDGEDPFVAAVAHPGQRPSADRRRGRLIGVGTRLTTPASFTRGRPRPSLRTGLLRPSPR
jgi:arylsulfatase A-like enzyme